MILKILFKNESQKQFREPDYDDISIIESYAASQHTGLDLSEFAEGGGVEIKYDETTLEGNKTKFNFFL